MSELAPLLFFLFKEAFINSNGVYGFVKLPVYGFITAGNQSGKETCEGALRRFSTCRLFCPYVCISP
jgi:hypothetical protein